MARVRRDLLPEQEPVKGGSLRKILEKGRIVLVDPELQRLVDAQTPGSEGHQWWLDYQRQQHEPQRQGGNHS